MLHLLLTLLPFVSACALSAQDVPSRPRLIVLVSCDQLIPEQLERLAPWLDGGLARFWTEGTVYRAARLTYARTETGPGHATLATGCLPSSHGIVGNMFYDRQAGKTVYCIADPDERALRAEGSADTGSSVSPRNILRPTLAEHLRAAFPEAKVFSISFKDRSAVAMGGSAPSSVVWWDRVHGGFASSTYYGDSLPEFIKQWNETWVERAAGWIWEPSFDEDPGAFGTADDDRAGESTYGSQGSTFPYRLSSPDPEAAGSVGKLASRVYGYPLGDQMLADVAARAVEAMGLGADDSPDLLAVSFSGCDVIGHSFGPYSWEVTDLVLRTDDALGRLFDQLDARVGEGRWVAALTSDHGVLDLPERLQSQGIGARRVTLKEVGALKAAVNDGLVEAYGEGIRFGFDGRSFTLDSEVLAEAGLEGPEVRTTIARLAVGADWIAAGYTLEQLAGEGDSDPWLDLYRNDYCPGRNPDVVLRPQPWTLIAQARGTSHGSPYPYDRRIPLAFLGPTIPARALFAEASSADVVPTLLELLGCEVPGAMDGRVLPVDR